MVLSSVANSDSFQVTTPSDCEVRMTRLFNAPRERVFEAMTRPEHVKNWWGRLGEGYSVPVCEIDLRPGGSWRFVNRHPGGEATFYGEYREIVAPSKLVYTEIFADYPDSVSLITALFTAEGKQTRYTATCAYPSQQVRDMVLNSGMEHGAAASFDQLEALIQKALLQ